MSQTTLEDVFLRVAEAHNPGAKKPRGAVSVVVPHTETIERDGDGAPSVGVVSVAGGAYGGFVKGGYYLNGCLNNWHKITPVEGASPPAYDQKYLCFMLEWLVPIPCCCQPTNRMVLQPLLEGEVAADLEGAEVYESTITQCGGKAKHVWREQGKFEAKGTCGDRYRHVFGDA